MVKARGKILGISRNDNYIEVIWGIRMGERYRRFHDVVMIDELTTKMLVYNDFSSNFFSDKAESLIGEDVVLYFQKEAKEPKIVKIEHPPKGLPKDWVKRNNTGGWI